MRRKRGNLSWFFCNRMLQTTLGAPRGMTAGEALPPTRDGVQDKHLQQPKLLGQAIFPATRSDIIL